MSGRRHLPTHAIQSARFALSQFRCLLYSFVEPMLTPHTKLLPCVYWPNRMISDLFGHNRVFVGRSDAGRARGRSGLASTGVEAEGWVFVSHQ